MSAISSYKVVRTPICPKLLVIKVEVVRLEAPKKVSIALWVNGVWKLPDLSSFIFGVEYLVFKLVGRFIEVLSHFSGAKIDDE